MKPQIVLIAMVLLVGGATTATMKSVVGSYGMMIFDHAPAGMSPEVVWFGVIIAGIIILILVVVIIVVIKKIWRRWRK